MRQKTLAAEIAATLEVIERATGPNSAWEIPAETRLRQLCKFLPSGSGIDYGTKLDRKKSNSEKLVFEFGFHHMNNGGFYDGWTDHTAVVKPSFDGIDLQITGRDRKQIKDYLHDARSVEWVKNDKGEWAPKLNN